MKEENIKKRIEELRHNMKMEDLDSILIMKPENCQYYSGFTGSSAWLIISPGDAFIVTDGRYFEQVKKEAPLFKLGKAEKSGNEAMFKAMSGIVDKGVVGKFVGFEVSHVNVTLYNAFNERFASIKLIPADDVVSGFRDIKEFEEIELIQKAVETAEKGFKEIEDKIKEGITERKLAAELQYHIRLAGADKEAFDIIVAGGENSAMPHAKVSDRPLKEGDAVVIDWGAVIEGYHSDMTRTVFVGEPCEKIKEIYRVVYEAQQKVLDCIGPGMTTGEADAIARKSIEDAGYGDNFLHALGHGVGLAIHEKPFLKKDDNVSLEPGMVVTIEPGVYLPNVGGVRIEDLIVITEDGCDILTSIPKVKF